MLIDREQELAELDLLLDEPGAHLLAISGRRRLGKTTLLLEWARRSGQPYLYSVASRAPAPLLLRQFSQTVWRQAYPDDVVPATFAFDGWADAFEQVARLAADRRYIVILDEFPYAAEADSSLPSIFWTVRYAFFARAGFTEAARTETQAHSALLVDLATLDRDLQAVV